MEGKALKMAMGWCLVAHLGETEVRHTAHAIKAGQHWCEAEGVSGDAFLAIQADTAIRHFELHIAKLDSLERALEL